jgi:hypothetical protein
MKRIDDKGDGSTPAVASTAKPKNIPNAKRETTMIDYGNDISRGPYHLMLDKQALAHQAQFGGSYEQAFTKVFTDPSNRTIVDLARLDHLSKGHDAIHGTRLSLIPKVEKEAPYDPLAKAAELAEIRGPAHARLHSMAIDHQRAHPGMSYQSAYGYLYAKPENVSLRNAVKAEHMQATMAGLGKAAQAGLGAPPDPEQDYASPSSGNDELDKLIITRMKANPKLSYQQAFTTEYLAPANRSLKERVDAAGILRAQAREPTKPFPAYTAPGHR